MSPFFLLLLLPFLLFLSKNRHRSNLPPSPPSLPLLGHLHLIGRLPHRSLHSLFLRHAGACGLLLVRLGRAPTLVISTAAAAADIFKNHDLAFASRPASAAATKIAYGARNVSFAPYGDSWRRAKKIAVVHLLSPRRVASTLPARSAAAAALVRRFAASSGEPLEVRDLLFEYTNAVVTRMAVGDSTGRGGAERFRKLVGEASVLFAGFQAVDLLPPVVAWLVGKVSGMDSKLDGLADRADQFFSEILAEHKEKKGEEGEEDFMDVLLRVQREGTAGFEFQEEHIKAIVQDMMGAATDTSFVTLEWTMAELMRNPGIMAKLQDEVRRITDGKPTIAEEDLGRMEYMKAVIKEVLRLHPPAPLLVPHESMTDTLIRGHHIPSRTRLVINVWSIGRDPAAWDAPDEFRPERFVGSPVDFRGNDFQFIPFGAGRRMCPGIGFGLAVVEVALASLLYHFDWELPEGTKVEDLDMSEAPGLTTPLEVPLRLVPRCEMSC